MHDYRRVSYLTLMSKYRRRFPPETTPSSSEVCPLLHGTAPAWAGPNPSRPPIIIRRRRRRYRPRIPQSNAATSPRACFRGTTIPPSGSGCTPPPGPCCNSSSTGRLRVERARGAVGRRSLPPFVVAVPRTAARSLERALVPRPPSVDFRIAHEGATGSSIAFPRPPSLDDFRGIRRAPFVLPARPPRRPVRRPGIADVAGRRASPRDESRRNREPVSTTLCLVASARLAGRPSSATNPTSSPSPSPSRRRGRAPLALGGALVLPCGVRGRSAPIDRNPERPWLALGGARALPLRPPARHAERPAPPPPRAGGRGSPLGRREEVSGWVALISYSMASIWASVRSCRSAW